MQPKISQTLIFIGVLVVVAVLGFFFFKVLKATPSAAPGLSKVYSEPKTIGIVYFRQQEEAVAGLKEGLKDLGYSAITYKEFVMPVSDDMDKVAAGYAKTLVENRVDLMYTALEFQGLPAITTTKEMGDDTPIIFLSQFHDPVAYGLAKSFRSSGNNATGIALNIVEIVQKQLEFLKEIRPDIKKIGVFADGFMVPPLSEEFYPEFRRQAAKFGYEIVVYTTQVPPPEAEKAWRTTAAAIKPGDIDALYHIAGHYFDAQEAAESALAARLQIPMVAPIEDLPNGGHFGYSGGFLGAGRQSARMADKIFRGTKPGDIPLEYNEQIALVLYPERARLAGIVFPESILSIATRIVNDQ